MSSTIETGHAKNVANFKSIYSYCTSYAEKYNPASPLIKLPALAQLLADGEGSLKNLKQAESDFKKATNERVIGFEPIQSLATRVINALESTEASAAIVKDVRTINRKLQGKRAAAKEKPAPPISGEAPVPSDKTISVSQLSYDNQQDNFEKLFTLVSTEPLYTPNEPDLSVAGLQTKFAQIKQLNDNVVNRTTAMNNIRNRRNEILYKPDTGMVDIAQAVKKYLLSVYKATAPEYLQVRKIEVKKLKKK